MQNALVNALANEKAAASRGIESRELGIAQPLHAEALGGFGARMTRLNPLFSLGTRMDVGDLKPYTQNILLLSLLEVFYRELSDDAARTKLDLSFIITSAIHALDLEASEEQVVRLVSGLLFEGSEKLNKPFEALYYDDTLATHRTQSFRYLVFDQVHTSLERGGKIVYKLSDTAQEMIFMSREMSDELSITIEQLYSLQLIKNGNYRKAGSNLDHLIARVQRLLRDEEQFRRDLLNDPKVLLFMEHKQRESKEQEIKAQFEEERQRFKSILHLVEHAKRSSMDDQNLHTDLHFLHERLEYARRLHDQLANVVLQNIATELHLKARYPSVFWEKPIVSFREHLYEDILASKGCDNLDSLSLVLAPLFSPKCPFYFSLERLWDPHELVVTDFGDDDDDSDFEDDDTIMDIGPNWDEICKSWEMVFDSLLIFGEFSISSLLDLNEDDMYNWFEQHQTFELWMLFEERPLTVHVRHGDGDFNDEREKLLYTLMQRHERFFALEGKKISCTYDPDAPPLYWNYTTFTPFVLKLEESDES
jgi:hypothetical protein